MLNNAALHRKLPLAVGAVVLAALVACSNGSPNQSGAPGTPGAGGQVASGVGVNPTTPGAAAPPPSGAAGGQVKLDTTNFPFVDPVTEAGRASQRFFEGAWGMNGPYIEQAQAARTAALTFRQYTGDQLGGAGGLAPAKYRADVTVWVYQPNAEYPNMVGAPLGIMGYAPYFRDETHYMLAVAKPDALEVWAVDGFVPGTEWPVTNRLFSQPLAERLDVGKPIAWSVEVDTTTQSAKVWANGAEIATVSHPMLTNGGHKVALVSNGNYLHFQDFKLYRF